MVATPVLSGFARVTVCTPTTRADLAVPTGVPLAAVLPGLLRTVGHDSEASVPGRAGWMLCRLDGVALETDRTLRENAVRDGDVLVLQPAGVPVDGPLFDDVVEVLGDGDRWGPGHSRIAAMAVATVASLAGVGAVAALPVGVRAAAAVALGCAVVLLVCGAVVARVAGDAPVGGVLSAAAAAYAVFGAAGVVHGAPLRLLLACVAVLCVAVSTPIALGRRHLPVVGRATATGAAMAAGLGVLAAGVALLTDGGADRAAATVAVLALAATGSLPAVALRLARVPGPRLAFTAVELDEVGGLDDIESIIARVASARALLTGLWCGVLAVAACCSVVLVTGDGRWSPLLGVLVTGLLALRCRVPVSRTAAGATAGLAVTASAAAFVAALQRAHGNVWACVGVAATAVVLLACSAGAAVTAGRRPASPRRRQLLGLLDTLLHLATVPVALGVWGAYAAIGHLGR